MTDFSDFSQLCRLCLVEDDVNHSIFGETGEFGGLFRKITSCLPVSINKNDGLPVRICDTCSTKLDSFYQFRNETIKAEKQLLQWFHKNNSMRNEEGCMNTTVIKEEENIDYNEGSTTPETNNYTMMSKEIIYPTSTSKDEPPPSKRPKRASAMKALEHLESEDDDFDDNDYGKGDSDDDTDKDGSYQDEGPSTSMNDQPGPSGMGKGSSQAPYEDVMDFEDSLPFEEIYVKDKSLFDREQTEQIFIKIDSGSDDEDYDVSEYIDTENIFVPGRIVKITTTSSSNSSSGKKSKTSEICFICGKRVIQNLKAHMERHENEIECEECTERFKNMKEYEKHKISHETNSFPCEKCNLTFVSTFDLIKHNFKHFSSYNCTICSFATLNQVRIKNHVKRHESSVKFPCELCGKNFTTKGNLDNHLQIHSGIRRYQCEFCPKKFTTEHYKRNHIKFNHSVELFGVQTVYKCDVCSREFSFEKSLERHLSVIHNIGKSRKVECPICGKIIANNFNLKMHMTVHTGEKKHVCELCGKAFRDRTHLKRHNKVHEKQGEFLYL